MLPGCLEAGASLAFPKGINARISGEVRPEGAVHCPRKALKRMPLFPHLRIGLRRLAPIAAGVLALASPVAAQSDPDGSLDLDLALEPAATTQRVAVGGAFDLRVTLRNLETSEGPAYDPGVILDLPDGLTVVSGSLGSQIGNVPREGGRVISFEGTEVLERGDARVYTFRVEVDPKMEPGTRLATRLAAYADDSPFERGAVPPIAPEGTPPGGVDLAAPVGVDAAEIAPGEDDASLLTPDVLPASDSLLWGTHETVLILLELDTIPQVAEGERATGTTINAFDTQLRLRGNEVDDVEDVVLVEELPSNREFLGFAPLPEGVIATATPNAPTTGTTLLVYSGIKVPRGETTIVSYRSGIVKHHLVDSSNVYTSPTSLSGPAASDLLVADDEASRTSAAVVSAVYRAQKVDEEFLPADTATVAARYVAVQKSVSPGVAEIGDRLTARIDYQVSEYYELRGPGTMVDLLPDGTFFDDSVEPTVRQSAGGAWRFDNGSGKPQPQDGDTPVEWKLGGSDRIPAGATGTFELAFVVDNEFEGPGNDEFEATDRLTNTATMEALALDADTLANPGEETTDGSSASFTNPRPVMRTRLMRVEVPGGTVYDGTNDTPDFDFNTTVVPPGSVLRFALVAEFPRVPVLGATATAYLPLVTGPNTALENIRFITEADVDIYGEAIAPNDGDGDGTSDATFGGRTISTPGSAGTFPTLRSPNGIEFDLGNVAPGATFAVTYDAVVRDLAPEDVPAGGLVAYRNVGTGAYRNDTGALVDTFSDEAEFLIWFPSVTIDKRTVTSTSNLMGGSTVAYEVVLNNEGGGTAYLAPVVDTLDEHFRLDPHTPVTITDAGGANLAALTPATESGGLLTFNFANRTSAGRAILPGGTSATIRYTVRIDDAIHPNTTVGNRVDTDYFSAPEGGDSFGPLADSTTVRTANFALSKVIIASSEPSTPGDDITIGETVTYEAVLTIPQGSMTNVRIEDDLPNGMQLLSVDAIEFEEPIETERQDLEITNGGTPWQNRFVLTLGDVTNPPDGDGDGERIRVRYTARLMDVEANQIGDRPRNRVLVRHDSGGNRNAVRRIDVVAPELELLKEASETDLDAGDLVEYGLTVRHTGASRSDAFDLRVTDALPDNLSLVSIGEVEASAGFPGALPAVSGAGTQADPVTLAPFDLPRGEWIRFHLTARIDDQASGQEDVLNAARIEWDSLPGNPLERRTRAELGTHRFPLRAPALEKRIIATSADHTAANDVAIGEVVTFEVAVTPPDGMLHNVVLTDRLPDGLHFLEFAGTSLPDVLEIIRAGTPEFESGTITWDLGAIHREANVHTTVDPITLRYRAILENTTANTAGRTLGDVATLEHALANVRSDAPRVSVVEPALRVEKRVLTAPTYREGDEIRFVIEITSAAGNGADAFDLEVTDRLPAALTLDPESVELPEGAVAARPSDGLLVVTIPSVTVAQLAEAPLSIVYTATLGAFNDEALLETSCELRWTSLAGTATPPAGHPAITGERTGNTDDPGGLANVYTDEASTALANGMIVAWEDLKEGGFRNDFDYNDLVLAVARSESYTEQDTLERIDLRVHTVARGAGFDHAVDLDLGIRGGIEWSLRRLDGEGRVASVESGSIDGFPARGIRLFESTEAVLPPFGGSGAPFAANTLPEQTAELAAPGATIELTITVLDPEQNPRLHDNPVTRHLDEHTAALYGFALVVADTGQTVRPFWLHDAGTEDIVSPAKYPKSPLLGYTLPQGLILPPATRHPIERTPLWNAYPGFVEYRKSGSTRAGNWTFDGVQPELVWPATTEKAESPARNTVQDKTGEAPSAVSGAIAAADLDNDGTLEIVSAHYLGELRIHRPDGTVLAIHPHEGIVSSQSSPALLDTDGDGDLEILRGYDNGDLVVVHHDGSLTTPALNLGAPIKSTLAIGDINGDGEEELVAIAGGNILHVYTKTLEPVGGFPMELGGDGDAGDHAFLTPSPVLADIDADGRLDVVATSLSGIVHVVDGSGEALSGWPVDLGGRVQATPVVAALTGREARNVVVAMEDGRVVALTPGGETVAGWPVRRFLGGPSSPAAADLDGDARDEILVGSLDGALYAFDRHGLSLDGFPVYTSSAIHASPLLADVAGDATPEILLGNDAGDLHLWAADGQPLDPAPQARAATAIKSTPALVDGTGNGTLDIVAGVHDGTLLRVGTSRTDDSLAPPNWSGLRGTRDNNARLATPTVAPTSVDGWMMF